jgi:hypothetical protein
MKVSCLLLFGLVITACTEISFQEPQPKGVKKLKTFPPSLHGRYLLPEESDHQPPDTLIISNNAYKIVGAINKNDLLDQGTLGDSLVLKNYKGYYFINFHLDNHWVIRVFRLQKNGIVLYEVNLSDAQTLDHLKTKLQPVILKEDSNTFYEVDPTPKELLKFIQAHYTAPTTLRKLD